MTTSWCDIKLMCKTNPTLNPSIFGRGIETRIHSRAFSMTGVGGGELIGNPHSFTEFSMTNVGVRRGSVALNGNPHWFTRWSGFSTSVRSVAESEKLKWGLLTTHLFEGQYYHNKGYCRESTHEFCPRLWQCEAGVGLAGSVYSPLAVASMVCFAYRTVDIPGWNLTDLYSPDSMVPLVLDSNHLWP